MRIRQLTIENFRGIKSLDWKLPTKQRLITLVGPGDSGKSSILDAVHYLLGDRWNVVFSDTDFYAVDIECPISIRAILVDLPEEIRRESVFGFWLSGLDKEGELHQDPEDHHTPALVTRLTVDSSLEPKWTVERADGTSASLTASQRRFFSTFKVDDRNDAQLRWSRTSALGRMSARDGGERDVLSAASRAAREALADHGNSALASLAQKVQERTNKIGGGRFSDLKPGLDTSRSAMGTGLALYEDIVPLTSYGLGSRRLASFAIQQLAAGARSVAVVDEIENGLEPHRAARLLNYLLTDDDYSQVLVTTHSPIIVEQAQLENLAVVRTTATGVVTVSALGETSERVQKLRRSRPSSFLARRIVIAEGATEYGLLMECLASWDQERIAAGLSTSAGEGAALQDGAGGSEVPLRVTEMAALGFEVAGFMDNDVRDSDTHVAAAESAGASIIRWDHGHNTETQICSVLEAQGLTTFVQLGVQRRNAASTVLQDLNDVDTSCKVPSLDVEEWIAAGITITDARQRIAKAAVKRKWFKEIEGGKALGGWLMKNRKQDTLAAIIGRLDEVKAFIFNDETDQPMEEAASGDGTSNNG
jgi:putative ATP-dependent endonuclease of OLD family